MRTAYHNSWSCGALYCFIHRGFSGIRCDKDLSVVDECSSSSKENSAKHSASFFVCSTLALSKRALPLGEKLTMNDRRSSFDIFLEISPSASSRLTNPDTFPLVTSRFDEIFPRLTPSG